jgi:N-glycosylase/DNA lyase
MIITAKDIRQGKKFCAHLIGKNKSPKEMFYELCFCLCSPMTKWESNVKVNRQLRNIHYYSTDITSKRLRGIVKPVRFFRNKAGYLQGAKSNWKEILEVLRSDRGPKAKRKWLVTNINGLGWKTASHFLRNAIGITNLAILDTHLLKYLGHEGGVSTADYMELEKELRRRAEKRNISVAVLDAVVFMRGSKAEYLR